MDRNTIVGIDFLVVGFFLTGFGYIIAQSIPIAAIGVDVAILGALILLIVPEPIPQDAYRALLVDSISNVEMILEESHLENRAYFVPLNEDGGNYEQKVRAFIPATTKQRTVLNSSSNPGLMQSLLKSHERFIQTYGGETGLLLIPPGNELVKLSKVGKEDDLEDSLRSVLVGFSDLASSVMLLEEKEGSRDLVKINISNPKISSESPFFNRCLGSPVSCIASCVVAVSKGKAVRAVDEKKEMGNNSIHLTLEIIGGT